MSTITVLMSTYNGEKYLREQLDSVMSQQLPEDIALKIRVRDDGSNDSTQDILREYELRGGASSNGIRGII